MSWDDPNRYYDYIRRALATPGGHLSIGRGGFTLHFENSRLSGYDDDVIKAVAIAAGLPVIDSRMVPFELAAKLAVKHAEFMRAEFEAGLYREEGGPPGFAMMVQPELGPGALWLHSDDQGDPEHVIQFVLRLAEELSLAGVWGFSWSHTCSKPRIDAFGGGAHVIDLGARRSIADIDCSNFVHEQIAREPAEVAGERS